MVDRWRGCVSKRRLAAFSAAALGALGLVVGCTPNLRSSAYPLYLEAAGPLPADEVARALGPLASVDGRDVAALGSAFALQPGCHWLELRRDAFESTNYVTISGGVSTPPFAVWMKPGHTYAVRRAMLSEMGSRLRLVAFAEEWDPGGKRTGVVYTAQDEFVELVTQSAGVLVAAARPAVPGVSTPPRSAVSRNERMPSPEACPVTLSASRPPGF